MDIELGLKISFRDGEPTSTFGDLSGLSLPLVIRVFLDMESLISIWDNPKDACILLFFALLS
jgi:hypothetical protein